ncbi:lysozyme inhibitor LprI family protein [Martelella sp. AMO21009]
MQMFDFHSTVKRSIMAAVFATATCLGSALLVATPASAASFDCSAAGLTPNERTICSNLTLNDDDVKMATMYTMLKGLFAMGVSGNMGDDQKAWLKEREACGTDVSCIEKAYDTRIDQLQKLYDGIDKPL